MDLDVQQPDPDSQAAFGNPSHLPHGEANLTPLAQLKRMQRVLYAATIDPETEQRLRPQFACAWERLEQRKAVLTGKPGSLTGKVEAPIRKRKVEREPFAPLPAPLAQVAPEPPKAQ